MEKNIGIEKHAGKVRKNPLPSYVLKMVVTIYSKTIQDSYFKYGIQTKVHTTMDPPKKFRYSEKATKYLNFISPNRFLVNSSLFSCHHCKIQNCNFLFRGQIYTLVFMTKKQTTYTS